MLINRTRAGFYVHTIGVNIINLVHALCVKHNAAGNRQCPALRAAACAPCRYGDFIIVCNLQYLRGFVCVLRRYNNIRLGHSAAAVSPHT